MNFQVSRPFDHVLIIMFENQYRSYVMKNPYFQSLAKQGIDLTNYYGVFHPSQTNYIASTAAELCNVSSDDYPGRLPQRNIVDLIEESPLGLSWKAYMDSYIPQNQPWEEGMIPKDEYPYLIKHNPFSSFQNIIDNPERWEKICNEAAFWQDLLNGNFPNYAWFTPNMWNDGHYLDGTTTDPEERAPALVDQAAQWLESFFEALRFPGPDSHLPPRTLVVVTFDEADFEKAFDANEKYTYDGPNQIYTVLLGDMIEPGTEEGGYNHYSLIRTLEKNFNLNSLLKNDTYSNWMQFLWGKQFNWWLGEDTPINGAMALAAAPLDEAMYLVWAGKDGELSYTTCSDWDWGHEQLVGYYSKGPLAMVQALNALWLAYKDSEGGLSVIHYTHQRGWSEEATKVVIPSIRSFGMVTFEGGRKVMLVYAREDGQICSLTWQNGAWDKKAVNTGFSTQGDLTLSVLGSSVYLIFQALNGNHFNVVSYNTAPFNVVTVPDGQYGGSYDNTTLGQWSPCAFPVQHFSAAPNPVSPGEAEPVARAYQGNGPLVNSTLEGVLYLAHVGAAHRQVLTENFSIQGIMTPLNSVSYDPAKNTITSNGYGTLAEAGWSRQSALPGVFNGGAMAMASQKEEIILYYQSEPGGSLKMAIGRYDNQHLL